MAEIEGLVKVPTRLEFMFAPEREHVGAISTELQIRARDTVDSLSSAVSVLGGLEGLQTELRECQTAGGSSVAADYLELLNILLIQVRSVGPEPGVTVTESKVKA